MMSAYANSLQKPEGFDRYVRKFRSICTMHGVQIGSRTELPDFMRKLVEDRHLAMDFWAFVGKLSDREGGELSDDQLLGVVVEGITDAEISEEDGGQKRTVDDLRAMLAGVDVQGSEQSQVEMAPFPQMDAGSQRDDKQLWTPAEELATKPSNSQAPVTPEKQMPLMPEKPNGEVHHASVLPATPPPQLDEALLRLELTKLVQQYFDNIDKRISKLEPPADGETSTGTIATAVTRRSLEEPVSPEEMEELRLRRTGRTRLVLESSASPAEGSLPVRDDDDIPMRVPLEHYSPPARFGTAPLLLVLVLVGAAFAIYRDPALLRKGYDAAIRQLHSYGPVTLSKRSDTQSTSSNQEAPATTEPSQPSPVQSALEGTSTPPPANTPEQITSSAGLPPAGNDSDSGSNRKTVTDRAVAQTEQAIADGISSIEAAGAIKVNPSVMDQNLVVSRVPAYPEVAKISGVEGDVVMQALISKEGTVKRVHVMEGDSRLRSAAEEAVYKWRYRPYVLHGRPVEVATTVTVNFNLDRR
jgi:TonB family protein